MGKSKLKQIAIAQYKISPLASWLIGLKTGLLISAILAIDFIIPMFCFISFPLLIVPILFGSTVEHSLLENKIPLTFRNSLKAFSLYFRQSFFGSFSIIRSFLWSLLVFLGFETMISFVTSQVMQYTSPEFVDAMNTFYSLIEDSSFNMNDLNNVLTMNNYVLLNYACIVLFPSIYAAIIFFIYKITRYAITIYLRSSLGEVNNRFVSYVFRNVTHNNMKKTLRSYFSLHWPLFVLLIIGLVGGTVGGFFIRQDVLFVLTFAIVSASLLVTFYLPFYFSNQEALFTYFDNDFQKGIINITNKLLVDIQKNIDLSNEEKEELEKKISSLNNPLDDEENKDDKK